MRALRLLHRDLSDLCPARRRARQPPGADLSHQGHAGERPPGDGGRRQAHRPLPLLPVVYDDLPLGRPLHAPRRPRPASYRKDLSPAMAGPRIPPSPGLRPASAKTVQGGAQRIAFGQTVRSMGAGSDASDPGSGPIPCAGRFACRSAAGFRDPDADPARGVAQRLRPAGPGAADQRGDDPALDAARLRGCRAPGSRLLRGLDPSSRPGGERTCPRQHPGLVPGNRGGRAGTARLLSPVRKKDAACGAASSDGPDARAIRRRPSCVSPPRGTCCWPHDREGGS